MQGSDRGRKRATDGGARDRGRKRTTEGRSGQGLGWPTCTDRGRPAPTDRRAPRTELDPHRQSGVGSGLSAWCARNGEQGAPRLRLPPPWAGGPDGACGAYGEAGGPDGVCGACGGSDKTALGERPPLGQSGGGDGGWTPHARRPAAQGARGHGGPRSTVRQHLAAAGRRRRLRRAGGPGSWARGIGTPATRPIVVWSQHGR